MEILGAVGATVVIMLIIIIKIVSANKKRAQELRDSLSELERENSELYKRIEKDKVFYGKDRQILVSEHKAEKVELEHCREKLKYFTKQQRLYYDEMDNLSSSAKEMTPEELLDLRREVDIEDSGILDFTGIYILYNQTMDKYYVGQSITVIRRAAKHFMEEGNEDIYEDYQAGEKWTVKLIALSNSGFRSINALEKHFIEYYHSTWNGYNRTIGNRT